MSFIQQVKTLLFHNDNSEKHTKFFFLKEKSHAKAKTISHLLVNNQTISQSNAIVSECRKFYAELYSAEPVDNSLVIFFF